MWFLICFVFFFKQKTAYEMRISDWSSDVCSSDLDFSFSGRQASNLDEAGRGEWRRLSWIGNEGNGARKAVLQLADRVYQGPHGDQEIGRASCRERVCKYV